MANDPPHLPPVPPGSNPLWSWPSSPQDWERTPASVQSAFLALAATVRHLQAQVAQLQAQVGELTRRLGQDSQKSGRPLSSDALTQKEQRKKSRRERRQQTVNRRQGGQPGHPGRGSRLLQGQRFGLIKFGSRTELIVPAGVEILVREGDVVRGGETVMARIPQG